MPPPRRQLIERAYRAFAARDLESLKRLAHPEVEIRTLTGVVAGREEPYRGHEGLAEYMQDVARVWDELELTPAEYHELSTGDTLVFGRVRARRGSTLIDTSNAWLWRIEDDRIVSAAVFGDAESAAFLLEPPER